MAARTEVSEGAFDRLRDELVRIAGAGAGQRNGDMLRVSSEYELITGRKRSVGAT